MHARITIAALAALVFALPTLAQTDDPASTIEGQIEVTEVLLDVLVTDQDGNVIVGLTKEDFEVEEEGAAIELTDATFYSNRRFVDTLERAENLGVDPTQIPTDRFFVVFFHDRRQDSPVLMSQMLDAARFSKRWVDTELLPNDHVAVVSYDVKLKVFEDFTTDKGAIKKAIDNAMKNRGEIENWPSRREGHTGPSLLANLPEGRALDKKSWDFHIALRMVGEAAGSIIGRKNVLLFSPGFGRINEVGQYQVDMRYYPVLQETLNDNNVAVYSIDLFTRTNGITPTGRDLADSLSLVATDTGGQIFDNFNSFLTPLRLVEEDNNGYYLLSYRSSHSADESGYRTVNVKAKNPQFQVRSRSGYRFGES